MKSHFGRFLHHTMSHSNGKPQSTPILSYSGLTRISRWKKFANWFNLDTPIKSECDSLCAGRSMVEMLGVLAIIGVLSVGAIAGYGKAMFKYKLNKQTEQLNQVIDTIVRYKSSLILNPNPADADLSDFQLVPLLKKLGEIPKEMYTNKDISIKDSFGTEYYVYNRNNQKSIVTLRTYTLERNESSFQTCKNLYLIAKEWHNELNAIFVIAYRGEIHADKDWYCGDNNEINTCYKNTNLKITDLKLTDLDDICRNAAEEQGEYSIVLRF